MATIPVRGYNHPALIPDNIHAMLKILYKRDAMAQELFRTIPEPLPEYRDIFEKDIVGDVGEITGTGGFNKITGQFKTEAGVVKGFGAYFELGPEEKWWSRINLLSYHMDRMSREMRLHYEKKVLTAIKDISGASTFDGSDWTDTTAGDPFKDLERARGKIRAASGLRADIAVMNQSQYENLISFKEFREFQFLGKSLLEQGELQRILTPNGLELVVFEDSLNSYIEDNKVYVSVRGRMGVNHETIPFTTTDRQGSERNPLKDFYYGYEWKEAAIDEVDAKATCVITGLDD